MTVAIRFYEELNYFIPEVKRKKLFPVKIYPEQTVKDLIESLGVPHVEVDLILINGRSVDFSFIPRNGAKISVYPVFESLNISGVTKLRQTPLRNPAFALDVHLGKLARYLRLVGFRADYRRVWEDSDLVSHAVENNLIILSRDRGLLKRKIISRGLFVYNTDPREQIKEICRRLDIYSLINPFSRCLTCSGILNSVKYNSEEFDLIKEQIPPGVLSWCRDYKRCGDCGKIYWEGSHMEKLKKLVSSVTDLRM